MTIPAPAGKKYLPYQLKGIEFCRERKAALLADEQGLGKTIQAAGIINSLKIALTGLRVKAVIVCPASLKYNWQQELREWLTEPYLVHVIDTSVSREVPYADIYVINYDLLARPNYRFFLKHFLQEQKGGVLICDEAHYLKNPSAQRTKAVLGGKINDINDPMVRWFQRVYFLTGTPVQNRPIELYPMLRATAPDLIHPHTSFLQFGIRYCNGHQRKYGWDFSGATNLEELRQRLKSFMIRRVKREVLTYLPDMSWQVLPLEWNAKTKALATKDSPVPAKDLSKIKLSDMTKGEIARWRHEIAVAKTPQCLAHILELLETGVDKLVVFYYHIDVGKALLRGIREKKHKARVIDGSTPTYERQKAVKEFQDGDLNVFIGQITATGTGFTLTAANHIVFVESSFVPGEVEQAAARAHRIGQHRNVLAQFLVVRASLEEHMLRSIVNKQQTIRSLIDHDKPQYDYFEN